MGCDIHILAERYDDAAGRWELVGETKQDEDGYKSYPEPYDGRNYNLFAMLAGVRDNHGITPISGPRGIPTDACPEAKDWAESWDVDGHSHSWLTVVELDAYDWQQIVTESGWVTLDGYKAWRDNGAKGPPATWCGGVGGCAVEHLTRLQADRMLDGKNQRYAHRSYYVPIEWTRTYAECAKYWLEDTMPKLRAIGPPDKVRVVFFFDN